MMRDDGKRLVRGLKDISPLFIVPPEEPPVRHASELQVLAVSSPDGDEDSLFLNSFFATQVASGEKACSLVSVLSRHTRVSQDARSRGCEAFGDHLKRYCLYWDELRDVVSQPAVSRESGVLKDRDIFLDFEHRQIFQFDPALSLIDKWILVLKPTGESLTEGYKMMKSGLALNPQLRFFITLEGPVDVSKGEWVVGKFSDFVFKHLNANIGWLGWVDLSDPDRHFSAALHADSLLYQPWNARPDLGKFALAHWVESSEQKAPETMLLEVFR